MTKGNMIWLAVGVAALGALCYFVSLIGESRQAPDAAREAVAAKAQQQADLHARIQYEGLRTARSQLKDGESARFSHLVVVNQPTGGGVLCGAVNAKNSFGGYTGDKLFFVAGDVAVFQAETEQFAALFQQFCAPGKIAKE